MHRRTFLVSSVSVLAAGAAGAYVVAADAEPEPAGTTPNPTSGRATATVTTGDLASTREFRASITFGDPWSLAIAADGVVTASHAAGTVVRPGESLVRVNERPVVLAAGTMPLYRTLEKIDTRRRDENNQRLRLLEGPDVRQLQQLLADTGHDADGALELDGVFGSSTEKAVKAWQETVGLSATGRVDSGQLVFAVDAVRVATELRVGSQFAALDVTRAEATVQVDTNNRDRSAISPDTPVQIVVPGAERIGGSATKQEQTVGADGSPIWRTTITPDADLPDGLTSATIEVVDVAAADATLVPASALLALAEGGFAVELVDGDTTRLIRVELIDVLDGRAAVRGDVSPGDTVVVPT